MLILRMTQVIMLSFLGGVIFSCREIQAGAKLSLNRQFFDERWSKHRVVSCLDWSSQVSIKKSVVITHFLILISI
jgi:hypothetical protein